MQKSPDRHYATMTPSQIAALPVESIAADDAILALWVTSPHLEIGMDTIKAWGFSPVVDDGPRGFDKWDALIYALSGASACLVGALYPFWFTGTWQVLLVTPLAGVIVGGVEKKLNPFLGGLFTASFTVWLTSLGRDVVGLWITENPYMVALGLLLLSFPLFPRGIVGSIRRVVEYGY